MLFRYLARSRVGESAGSELEGNIGRLKTKEWPYAVTELYLGNRSPAETLAAAVRPDDRCEAQFYIGEWYLLKGDRANAKAALKAAVETCPKTFTVYRACHCRVEGSSYRTVPEVDAAQHCRPAAFVTLLKRRCRK